MLNRSRFMAYLLVGWGLLTVFYMLWKEMETGGVVGLSPAYIAAGFTTAMAGLALLVLIGEVEQRLKEQRPAPQEDRVSFR